MRQTISGSEAVAILASGQPLRNLNIQGCVNLHDKSLCDSDENINLPLEILNCEIEALDSPFVCYNSLLRIENCVVQKARFLAAYFVGGLEISGCEFVEAVDFSCGGHNCNGALIRFHKTVFHGFVRFWDCWFTGPVEVTECVFEQGTDLLDFPYLKDIEGKTDIGSLMTKDNIGTMDINGYDFPFSHPDFAGYFATQ